MVVVVVVEAGGGGAGARSAGGVPEPVAGCLRATCLRMRVPAGIRSRAAHPSMREPEQAGPADGIEHCMLHRAARGGLGHGARLLALGRTRARAPPRQAAALSSDARCSRGVRTRCVAGRRRLTGQRLLADS